MSKRSREEATLFEGKELWWREKVKEMWQRQCRLNCHFHSFAHGSMLQSWERTLQTSYYREWNWSGAPAAVLWNPSEPLPQALPPTSSCLPVTSYSRASEDVFLAPRKEETPLLSNSGSKPWQTFLRPQGILGCFHPNLTPSFTHSQACLMVWQFSQPFWLPLYFSEALPLMQHLHIKCCLAVCQKRVHNWTRSPKGFPCFLQALSCLINITFRGFSLYFSRKTSWTFTNSPWWIYLPCELLTPTWKTIFENTLKKHSNHNEAVYARTDHSIK